jgi:hypothetical protein
MTTSFTRVLIVLGVVLLATGCAGGPKPRDVDYTAFKESNPRSIVVLPPLNETQDVKATDSVLSLATYPLAESGYYVLPVALVEKTFNDNGLTSPSDIQAVDPAKLRHIFGADAALYLTVTDYGAKYLVADSVIVVTVTAKLVDIRTGSTLWVGKASANSDEGNNNSGGGLIGMLVTAAVKQVLNSSTNAGRKVAVVATNRLLSADVEGGVLYGPRYPKPASEQP